MQDPYVVLGLPPTASEAEIRGRYLQLVREFPPDRAPERFAEIRAAFDELRDPLRGWQRQIFDLNSPHTIDGLMAEMRQRLTSAKFDSAKLLSLASRK